MTAVNTIFLASLLISGFYATSACVYTFGSRDEAAAQAGGHYTYSYNGLDWANDFPKCRGSKQSPVLLPSMGMAAQNLKAPDARSSFSYGTLTNPTIVNNGHTLQVTLPADFTSNVTIPIKGDVATATGTSILSPANNGDKITYVKATPAQFHFHTHSEHIMAGASYPLEMHIVHFIKKDQLPACGDAGCPVVLGIMFALTRDESQVSPALRKIIEAMPLSEGKNATINGAVNVDALLPTNRTYFTYEGSLTTPPCSEGILWHVLATPIQISQDLLTRYQEAVGDYNCPSGDKSDAHAAGAPAVVAEDGENNNGGGYFKPPPKDTMGCVKLANGHNYRAVQPINGRTVYLAQ